MKNLTLLFLILCFTQYSAQAQTENVSSENAFEIKEVFLKNDALEQKIEKFAESHRKDFADLLNQKPAPANAAKVLSENEKTGSDKSEKFVEEVEKEEEATVPPEKLKHRYEVQFNQSIHRLSGNYGTWYVSSLYFQRKSADRKIIWGQYRNSKRRTFRDQEVIGGIYKPLGKKWAFTAEGMYSPTKHFVGGFSAMGEVERIFKGGWVGHVGARYTSYTTVKATTSYALVEKYWGNNRLANTIYITHLSNAGTAPSYRVQYNRYYGERVNSFGAAFSFGREHENIGPPVGILRANTWSVSGSFRHWVTENFGINVDALLHRQGDIYYRRGLNFGARYRF